MSKRRAQKQKPNIGRNEEFAIATRTRHAAAARPQRLKTDYRRKPKHPGKGWD